MIHRDEQQTSLVPIMTTEYFVLQTARTGTIQEASQRASLFLAAVSSATIALAFVAQVTQMGRPFVLFSLILLPCLFFVGAITFARTAEVAIEDMILARGMARIRHFYIEREPMIARYLVHSTHDDRFVLSTETGTGSVPWPCFTSTAFIVGTLNSAIAGVFAGVVVAFGIPATTVAAVAVGGLFLIVSAWAHWRYQTSRWNEAEGQLKILFPKGSRA